MNSIKKFTCPAIMVLAVFSIAACRAQSFQGTITYAQEFEVPKSFIDMGITKEMMSEKLKGSDDWFDTVRVSYKEGGYYVLPNSKKKSWKVYKPDVNKIYSFSSGEGGDICVVQIAVDLDMEGAPDKPAISQPDSTVTINGHPCKIVRMKWKLGAIDYYYNSAVGQVKPELFAQHTNEGFSEFVKISRSLPLRIDRMGMGMKVVQSMVSSKMEKIKDELFKIPTLIPDKELNFMNLPGMEIFRVKK